MLSAVFAVPLGQENWTELKFNKIPANQVTYENQKIIVSVNQTASPLIYKIDNPKTIDEFSFNIEVVGNITETDKFFSEDSYFRLGLVAIGKQTLSGLKKMLAPNWVQKLFSLAPANVGLDKIYFYNVMSSNQKIGQQRIHPNSELMEETVIEIKKEDQRKITVNYRLANAKKISALWISIDGDNTKSDFKTILNSISLTTNE
jgi:hypothetical protein